MKKQRVLQNYLLPTFPVKPSKAKPKPKPVNPSTKLSYKLCKQLLLLPDFKNLTNTLSSYKSKNNFCEVQPVIMSPIKLNRLEIFLPEISATAASPKARPKLKNSHIGSAKKLSDRIERFEGFSDAVAARSNMRVNSAIIPGGRRVEERRGVNRSVNFTQLFMKKADFVDRPYSRRNTRLSEWNHVTESEGGSPLTHSPGILK